MCTVASLIIHNPDSVLALQRLDEVKDAIGVEKWMTAHDVVLISVRQFSRNVTSMVSPAGCLFPNNHTINGKTIFNEDDSLVFALGYERFRDTQQQQPQQELSKDHAVRPIIVTGGGADLRRRC